MPTADLFAPAADAAVETPVAPAPAPASALSVGDDGLVPCPHFRLEEHASSSYAPRTYANAEADATWAYAIDFDTAGERLTAKAAGDRLLQTKVGTSSDEAATALVAHLRARKATTLNVAGNGLYTLLLKLAQPSGDRRSRAERRGVAAEMQARLDAYVLRVLTKVHAEHPLAQIRSGGQSGVDEAGIKAGLALGIPTLALLPKGFRMRTVIGEDVSMSYSAAWRRFIPSPDSPDKPF